MVHGTWDPHGIHCFYSRLWDRFEVVIYINKSFIYVQLLNWESDDKEGPSWSNTKSMKT